MKRVLIGFTLLCVASISAFAVGQVDDGGRGQTVSALLLTAQPPVALWERAVEDQAGSDLDLSLNQSVVPAGADGAGGRFRIEVDGLQWCCDDGDYRCCLCPTPGCPW